MASTPASATFCFSPPERMKVSIPQMGDLQKRRDSVHTLINLRAGRQVFQPKSNLIEHLCAEDLALGSCNTVPTFCEIVESFHFAVSSPKIRTRPVIPLCRSAESSH